MTIPGLRHDAFDTTHWSLVVDAGERGTPAAEQALARLCEAYWPPLYGHIRRRVADSHEAHDLTQEFFACLLEKNYLAEADPARGRFRAFLLTACKHFLSKQWDKAMAQKRGGGQRIVPLDASECDSTSGWTPADGLTPEQAYDRQWAITLLAHVLEALEHDSKRDGQHQLFTSLKPYLTGQPTDMTYAELAGSLGMTEAAVKMAVHRLRKRYRERLRCEIAQTVADPAEIDDEIRHLFAAFE